MVRKLPLILWFILPGISISSSLSAQSRLNDTLLLNDFQHQEFGEAILYLQGLDSSTKSTTQCLSLLGYAYYMDDQLSKSLSAFHQVLLADSADQNAQSYIASIFFQTDNLHVSLRFYRELHAERKWDPFIDKRLSIIYDKMDDKDSALVYLFQAYRLRPLDPDVVSRLGDLLTDNKQYVLADSILDGFLAGDSTRLNVISSKINSAYAQQHYVQILRFDTLLRNSSDFSSYSNALIKIALAYLYTKQFDLCMDLCNFLIDGNEKSETILYIKGMALFSIKKYDSSLVCFQQCIKMAIPDGTDTYYGQIGYIYESLKNYPKAIASFDTAYYIFHDPVQYYNIGRIYEIDYHNFKSALKYYKKYLTLTNLPEDQKNPIHEYVQLHIRAIERYLKKSSH